MNYVQAGILDRVITLSSTIGNERSKKLSFIVVHCKIKITIVKTYDYYYYYYYYYYYDDDDDDDKRCTLFGIIQPTGRVPVAGTGI